MKSRIWAWILIGAGLFVACSGGDGGLGFTSTPEAGRASCGPFSELKSYRYTSRVRLSTTGGESDAVSTPTPPPLNAIWEIAGSVKTPDRAEAVLHYPADSDLGPGDIPVVIVGNQTYHLTGGVRWSVSDTNPSAPLIPFLPAILCEGLAPDVAIGGMAAQVETVGDVPADRYHFDSLDTDFSSRVWGPGSDMGQLVKSYQVDVWLAEEGQWPVRIEMEGRGTYPDGRELTVEVAMEVSDLNDGDIKIEPPVAAP